MSLPLPLTDARSMGYNRPS